MNQIKNLMKMRKNDLLQLKEKKEKELVGAPEGSLRVCEHGKRTQYYLRNDPKDFSGVYIRKENIAIAQGLAQKDYDKKILGSAKQEVLAIDKYLQACPQVQVEQIYETMHNARQKLVVPIEKNLAQYIEEWEKVSYRGKGFDETTPEIYTAKGERVRSKSEVIIADLLYREGIPYRYEYPIRLKGWGEVYPDFTVLNVGTRKQIYWEHLGMMDNPDYVETALEKIAAYEQNDIWSGNNLILTYETKNNPINQKQILRIIRKYLK